MLRVILEDGQPRLRVFCDWCDLVIRSADHGSYLYQADSSGTPIDGSIYYIHKDCWPQFEANSSTAHQWYSLGLDILLEELSQCLAVDDKAREPQVSSEGLADSTAALPVELAARLSRYQLEAYRAAVLAGGITASNYQAVTGRSPAASKHDLEELVALGVLRQVGKGRAVSYVPALHPAALLRQEPTTPADVPPDKAH